MATRNPCPERLERTTVKRPAERQPAAKQRVLAGASASDALPFAETAAFRQMMNSEARLIVVSGPPGYGKTTLLRAFADGQAARACRTRWASVDAAADFEDMTGGRDASTAGREYWLIDDAHTADPRRLNALLRTAGAPGRGTDATVYVVATRKLPEIDWLSLELSGQALLLRLGDLALSEAETASLLALYSGHRPSAEQVREIQGLTEGWPIAVQLCGQIARRAQSWSGLPICELRPRADLCRYLNERVYAELDDAMRGFLFMLADFERFSAEQLEAIVGAPALSLLNRALLENTMVMPAAGGENWFRLHGIFRNFLVDKKRQAGGGLDAGLLARAGDWCVKNGAVGDAVEYALKAQDHERAQSLLLAHAPVLVHQLGELKRMLDWVDRLDRAGHEIAIPLRLWKTWALTFTMHLDAASDELAQIESAMPEEAPAAWRAHWEKLHISILSRRGDMPAAVARSETWIERWREVDPFQSAAVAALKTLGHFHLFEEQAARRSLAMARQCALKADSRYAEMWVAIIEALIDFESGRALSARDHIETALFRARASNELSESMIATLRLVVARIQVETGDAPEARRNLTLGHASLHESGLGETHVAALEAAVLLAERTDGTDAALTELRHAPNKGTRLEIAAKLLEVHLLLRAGRTGEARQIFDASIATLPQGLCHVATGALLGSEYEPDIQHAQAWLALAEGDIALAETLTSSLLVRAEAHGRRRRQIALLLLAASTRIAAQHQGDARRFFIRALRFAAEGGMLQTVVQHSWSLRPVLAQEIDPAELGSAATAMLERLRTDLGIVAPEALADLPPLETLTARECEVLRLLDSGLTGRTLADRMDLSLSTAKWHMHNIYGKLGVSNRSGALAKARRLALL